MIYNITDTDYYASVQRIRAYTAKKNRSAYVMVFGCQQNEADGETIRGMLLDMGYTLCTSYEDADIIIVVTCAIRDHAEKKVLSMLGHFRKIKEKNPDLMIGSAPCYPSRRSALCVRQRACCCIPTRYRQLVISTSM